MSPLRPNRKGAARGLGRTGFTVLIAVTGTEARSAAQAESPDVVLMDVGLPSLRRHFFSSAATSFQSMSHVARSGRGNFFSAAGSRRLARLVSCCQYRSAFFAVAQASRGRHRPVLSAGRDGITLKVRCKGFALFEVAAVGTLSVYDRRGQRVGTVYLAQPPEPGQATMSKQLTDLLVEVLRRWQGPLPRWCYVTDAGDNETAYYKKHLRRLRHPVTGRRLQWHWIVDYYHASERLWTMAEASFTPARC
jgi:CheY-like chemotaxis protein